MHDLAPLKLNPPSTIQWDTARIKARLHDDLVIAHLKIHTSRAEKLAGEFGLPGPLRRATNAGIEALWVGPGEWILLVGKDGRDGWADYQIRLESSGGVVVARGDRFLAVELAATRDLLVRLTGLATDTLDDGRVARTRLADIPVILATGSPDHALLIFDRVFAGHMRAWLDRAI